MGHPINKKLYQGVKGPVHLVPVYVQKHKVITIVEKIVEKKASVNGPVDCNQLKLMQTSYYLIQLVWHDKLKYFVF